jgi:hypothetical protein
MAAVDAAALMPIPAGYEVVGKHVPAAAHWRSLNSRPDNFDADSVWTYTQKLVSEDRKDYSLCVFCSKLISGHNATKMQIHPSGCYSGEIATCVAVVSGFIPVWFRDCIKNSVVAKANAAHKRKSIGTLQQSAINMDTGSLASMVEGCAERESKSRLSGGQTTIKGSFSVATSTALSSAIATLIHGHGLSFSLSESPLFLPRQKCVNAQRKGRRVCQRSSIPFWLFYVVRWCFSAWYPPFKHSVRGPKCNASSC